MGIKNFFKKVGNGLKAAGRWVRDKAIPFIGRLAKPVLNVVSALPGKIGMIGKIGSAVAGVASSAAKQIPNANVRNKVQGWIEHERNLGREKLGNIRDIAERVNNGVNIVKDGVNNQIKPLINKS